MNKTIEQGETILYIPEPHTLISHHIVAEEHNKKYLYPKSFYNIKDAETEMETINFPSEEFILLEETPIKDNKDLPEIDFF